VKRFAVPPTWPSPPGRSWVPPKTWRPDPSWPPAPEGWKFWVDGRGNPVRGPIGRYGGPPHRVMYAGVAAVVTVLGVCIWALSAIGLFGGNSGDPTAVTIADDRTSSPSAPTSATPAGPKTTVTPPLVPTTLPESVQPTQRPPQKPTQAPTKSRTTEGRTEEKPDPTPTRTATTARTARPSRTSTTPPTQEEILRQYCVQHGWPAEWCDPDHWQTPSNPPRHRR
jgi:hypothetical protein